MISSKSQPAPASSFGCPPCGRPRRFVPRPLTGTRRLSGPSSCRSVVRVSSRLTGRSIRWLPEPREPTARRRLKAEYDPSNDQIGAVGPSSEAGYEVRNKEGRCNRHQIPNGRPLPDTALGSDWPPGDGLALLTGRKLPMGFEVSTRQPSPGIGERVFHVGIGDGP